MRGSGGRLAFPKPVAAGSATTARTISAAVVSFTPNLTRASLRAVVRRAGRAVAEWPAQPPGSCGSSPSISSAVPSKS